MPVDRPTFSESWYRVADMRPKLRATVQVHRQYYRGQMWHVLQDPASNQFFRLSFAAYRFVALLDGRRSVADAWRAVNEQLGDHAPTQGEAIQLLGQLYTSNLLSAELAPDAEGLFERYSKRRRREVQGYLSNLLFIRIPLLDPDHFLNATIKMVSWIFSWIGLVLWTGIIGVGLYYAVNNWDQLTKQGQNVLSKENLPLLYLSFALIKLVHEFGHAYACKKFGRQSGTGGEVHAMGIMFLIFTPIPYVDASSSWALRSKWQRAVIGAAGMYVELAVAAVAAVVWASVTPNTTLHALAYNVMFIASVSTILFNANPLLRYDGYYIFSDLVEIPNLYQRSKQYLYYLVKRYVWSVRQAQNPATSHGEKGYLGVYSIASTIYRVVICVGILLFVSQKLFFLGMLLALAAAVAWLFVPLGKFVHYLGTSGELHRVRGRAIATTTVAMVALVGGIGVFPAPDRSRVDGVVEPITLEIIHVREDGFVQEYRPTGQFVQAGEWLIRSENPELTGRSRQLAAERDELEAKLRKARQEFRFSEAQALELGLAELEKEIANVDKQLAALESTAPMAGMWISPQIHELQGAYTRRGDSVGLLADMDQLVVRTTAGQDVAGLLMEMHQSGQEIPLEIRMRSRPDYELGGTVLSIIEAGQEQLPSAALGYQAGGSVVTRLEDQHGIRTKEQFFEIRVIPSSLGQEILRPGQRVVVRFDMNRKPLISQWERSLRQLLQGRGAN